ncbi:dTDP-4-dehydrorhamnose reductase [Patescibacteria group bacterium]|nr:dTDP-4-dehydrorhamnose reductase [Patescibacteria group bacterium]
MKFLLTGANGMLGSELAQLILDVGYTLVATDRDQLDITNYQDVMTFVQREKPDVIINAAAYNFVDRVEEESVYPIAYKINAEGPANLARAAKEFGTLFVHYSTDYVFAGDKPEGYREDDVPNPISKYGETKLAGERLIQEVGGNFYICRLSKLFGNPGSGDGSKESFVALMIRLASEKPELNIVHEEVGSPCFAPDVARSTLNMILERVPSGIYHVVNSGNGVTWYEFAQEIFLLANIKTPFHAVTSDDFPKPASRPKYAALINTKLPTLRDRREALKIFIANYLSSN